MIRDECFFIFIHCMFAIVATMIIARKMMLLLKPLITMCKHDDDYQSI